MIAASLFFALTQSARLGLDLRGGTQIVLETKDSPVVRADAESTQRALEVLRQRVDALGVSEPSLYRLKLGQMVKMRLSWPAWAVQRE